MAVSSPEKLEYMRAWRAKNKERTAEANQAWRAKRRALLAALKDSPCMDCGGRFHPAAMDFDHRDPATKVDGVTRLVTSGAAWSEVLAEVAKCDLVCANCHRVRTWAESY